MDTITVKLPISALYQNGMQPSNNVFRAEIKKVNNVVDDYSFNNKYHSPFTVADQVPDNFGIEFKTNNYYTNNAYQIIDVNGNIVGTSSFTAANTVFNDNYLLTGCFRLVVTDSGNDGLAWWANSAQGSGYVRIKDAIGNVLKSFQTDFGGYFEYSFSTFPTTSLAEQQNNMTVNIFPNPAQDHFILSGNGLEFSEIVVTNVLGSMVSTHQIGNETRYTYDSSKLNPGVYFVTIKKDKVSITKKIVVN
jgi:hypothetical protein